MDAVTKSIIVPIGVAPWFVVGLIHLTYWLRGAQGPAVAILGSVPAGIGALGCTAGVPGLWRSRRHSSRRESERQVRVDRSTFGPGDEHREECTSCVVAILDVVEGGK